MVTLHEVITFLVSMQISISSLQTHNVNRCGRSRHLARKLSLRRKRSSPNVFEMAATETITSIILIKLIRVSLGTVRHPRRFKIVVIDIQITLKQMLRDFIGIRVNRDRKSGSAGMPRSEERFSRNAETDLVCRLLLEKKKDQQRDIVVSNRGAAALVLNGQREDGISSFRRGVDAHPKEPSLRLNLGLAWNMSSRFPEA